MDIWVHKIVPGIIRILTYVSIGVFVGSLLNSMGWLQKLSFLATPFSRIGGLPPQCCTAFVTAFASPRAANGVLSGAFDQKLITRNEMIIGALANTFPNTLAHIRVLAFAVIPLVGYAGLAYVLFQIAVGLGCTLSALLFGRLFIKGSSSNCTASKSSETRVPFRDAMQKAYKHVKRVLRRILIITVPLFILISYLDHFGLFASLANKLPSSLTNILPPASIAVLVGHMTNIMTAASVASELIKSQTLTTVQVFLTFLIGYAITIPIRAAKHSIPAAVGVFPAKDGMIIVLLSSGLRLFFTTIAIVIIVLSK